MAAQVQEHQQAAQRAAYSQDTLGRAQAELARCERRLDKAEKALLLARREDNKVAVRAPSVVLRLMLQ